MLRLMPAPPDWRWKSRNLGGRPPIDAGLRVLRRLGSSEPRGYCPIPVRPRNAGCDIGPLMTGARIGSANVQVKLVVHVLVLLK
jgi:hypothetical protein